MERKSAGDYGSIRINKGMDISSPTSAVEYGQESIERMIPPRAPIAPIPRYTTAPWAQMTSVPGYQTQNYPYSPNRVGLSSYAVRNFAVDEPPQTIYGSITGVTYHQSLDHPYVHSPTTGYNPTTISANADSIRPHTITSKNTDSTYDVPVPPAYNIRSGDEQDLDQRYKIQPKEFFEIGSVFFILWHESEGRNETLVSRISVGRDQFVKPILSDIRCMVVLRESIQWAWCLPVTTYGGQGVAKRDVDESKHAIVHMRGTAPSRSATEPDMTKKPLEVDPFSPDQKFDPMSRLNFGKIYIVEYNRKVLPVGRISPSSMLRFRSYARAELMAEFIPDDKPPVLAPYSPGIKSRLDLLGTSDISSKKDSDAQHNAVLRTERSKLQGEPIDSDTNRDSNEPKTKETQTELDKRRRHLGAYGSHAERIQKTVIEPPQPVLEGSDAETDDQLLFQVYQTLPDRDERYRDAILHFIACTLCQKGGIDPQTMHLLEYSEGRESAYKLFKLFTDEIRLKEKKGLRTSLSRGQFIIVDHIIKLINEHQDDIFEILPSKSKVTRSTDVLAEYLAEHLTHLFHQRSRSPVYNRQKPTGITESVPIKARLEMNHLVVLKWLVGLHQFEILAMRILRVCHGVDELKALEIQHQILSLPTFDVLDDNKRYLICFELEWDLPGILKSQYDGALPQLGSVLVLTGSALYAQATTCRDYMTRTWPETGKVLLASLEKFMEPILMKKRNIRDHPLLIHNVDKDMGLELNVIHNESKGKTIIDAMGTPRVLVEIAQELAWLVAAVNLSPDRYTTVHAETSISTNPGMHTVHMQVKFQALKSSEMACWLPLFDGATIAKGFPIMERGYERGLEIPLNIVMLLLCAQHAVEYRGSVIIKGFSAMLVPVQFVDDRVQWHLICSADPEANLQYQEGLQRCPTRLSLDEFGLEHLSKTRAIVGWCTAVTCLLGSKEANYHNLDYSKARDISQSLNVTGGTLGIQQIGVAQVDFALGGRHGRHHLRRAGPYRRIVALAEKTYVALYDTGENRGWLIPASNVMLHIAHHRHHLDPFSVGEKPVDLGSVDQKEGLSAKDVLLQNEKTKLMDDNGESYLFRDMILNIWSIMEYLITQQIEGVRSRGLRPREMVSDVLYGFEFKAITEERSPFRVKQTPVQHTSGGWPTLIRDIDALVLFASGYENVLLPALGKNERLCREWRTVPKGKDYLATAITTLKDIYDAAGYRLDRTYLTSTHLQWHRGNSLLWEPCQQKHSSYCNCKRVQQIVPDKPGFSVIPPDRLIDDGAIIIGGPNSLQRRSQPVKPMQGIYSQPNVTLHSTGLQNGPKSTEEIGDQDKKFSVDDDDDDDSDSYASLSSSPVSHSSQTPITSSNNSSSNTSQHLSSGNCLDRVPLLQV